MVTLKIPLLPGKFLQYILMLVLGWLTECIFHEYACRRVGSLVNQQQADWGQKKTHLLTNGTDSLDTVYQPQRRKTVSNHKNT